LVPGLLGGLNKLTGYDSLSSPFGDCKDLWSIHGPEEVQGNGLPFQNCQNDWQTWIFFTFFWEWSSSICIGMYTLYT
jgi:hypothetical protein